MGKQAPTGVVDETARSGGAGATAAGGVIRGRSEIGERIRARAEVSLRVIERHSHDLFGRYLTYDEVDEVITAAEALALLFGRLELPNIAGLARHLVTIFSEEGPWSATTGVRLAATCEDLRTLVESAIAQQNALGSDSEVVVVLGEESEALDAVCWLALTRGYAVTQADDRLPLLHRDPAAVVTLCPNRFTSAVGTRLRAVTQQWAAPLLVLHDGADPDTIGRLAVFGTTVLPLATPPGVITDELTRAVAAHRVERRALLCGEAPAAARKLATYGFGVVEVPDPDRLPEALGNGPGLVVFGPTVPARVVATTIHLLRASPALRRGPVLWIGDGHRDRELWAARLDVITVDEVDDALVTRIAGQLRRLAADLADAADVGGAILSWAAAQVLIDRTLVAAHRSGSNVALASVRLHDSVAPEVIASLKEVLGTEFRRNDVLAQRDDHTMVVALDGVPRGVAINRLVSLLGRLDLGADAARVGVALFPSDGRSAVELVAAADQAINLATEHDGPMVAATSWRPETYDVVDAIVVDADPVLSQVLVDLLVDNGLRAKWYRTGPETLAALAIDGGTATPRLLLLDLDVPGIDGLAMLRQLRTTGLLPQVKVILMTARASEADLRVALDIGVADVIRKPFSGTLLRHRIRLVLGDIS